MRQMKIGIAVIEPGVNVLRGSIGERHVDLDDDAIVVKGEGNGNGLGLQRG